MSPEDATAWSLSRLNTAFYHHDDRREHDAVLELFASDALYEVHGRTLRGHAEIPHALYARPGPEQQTSRHIPGVTHFRTVGAATAQGTIPLLGYGGLTPTGPGPAPCTVATGGHIFELSNHYQLGSGSWKIAHRTARQILTPVRD
ncbi:MULTISPECIES: nuclear transport factor 2 family protein [unclassified Streptomyces]|uniref:nuclear transport factor 2 family protein n=1 Tax=unclassified Streptomyces TaxID=2593676 RepID=UPI0036EB6C18